MTLLKLLAFLPFAAAAAVPAAVPPVPASFAATGADADAINALLATYTRAVSTKDRALFETLLLSPDIPFAYVPDDEVKPDATLDDYPAFRRGVFEGPSFTQRFRDVHVRRDGALAAVTLVFVNTSAKGPPSWGWKSLQLLKVAGRWKIASEFYTAGHPMSGRRR